MKLSTINSYIVTKHSDYKFVRSVWLFSKWSHSLFLYNYIVSDTPTDFSLTRLSTGLEHVQLSWSRTSPRYEVFYSLSGSRQIGLY